MARGTLRIYLGAAPGVGKTYAMLDEGWRRRRRGTDVVVGFVETHGRPRTAEQLRDLEVVPRRQMEYRGAVFAEMDLDAILARRPEVVLVDELAHTNVPGSLHAKRWQDVAVLLDRGIDVISTVNVQHLESLNDVVATITGITQHETVPDSFVRTADQIELVDMTPEALRRRMAHGNIYPPERIDAALANYFRPGNLGALRELALLWVADRVQDSLDRYLADHGIAEIWETRERVVVSLSGAPTGEALVRRAARIASRSRGDLLAVHVAPADGLSRSIDPAALARQRELVTEVGGAYHEVVGSDVARTVADFARSEHATQIVVGASRRSKWQRLWAGSVVTNVIDLSAGIDVHVIADGGGDSSMALPPVRRSPFPRRRRLLAWLLLLGAGPLMSAVLVAQREAVSLTTVSELFLALVVVIAAIGGLLPGLVASVAASLVINWYFTPPLYRWTIDDAEDVASLVVFIAIAVLVSVLADRVARRGLAAQRARAEAQALARSAASLATVPDPVPGLLDQICVTFGTQWSAIFVRQDGRWSTQAHAGDGVPDQPGNATVVALPVTEPGVDRVLAVDGRTLDAEERRLLAVMADEVSVGLAAAELGAMLGERDQLAAADAVRTALLRAVSHDLRTPLAAIKAYVSGLRQPDVNWSRAELDEVLAATDAECDRLNRLVGNLLDAGRLEAGALAVTRRLVAVDEIVTEAVSVTAAHEVVVDVNADLPFVDTDPVLVERALANVVENAVRHSPFGVPVRLTAQVVGAEVHVRVADSGPGLSAGQLDVAVRPFQRIGDDSAGSGVGLGLAIARGFVAAVGASLDFDDTPGGGLTVTIRLPVAAAEVLT